MAILSFFSSSAQTRKSMIIRYDTTARPGKVVLTDGAEIKGNVIFNDNDGIVIVRLDNHETKSFNAKRLTSFQFYASDLGRLRSFYCMEFPDSETGIKNVEFFEVLKEFNAFAVLSKIDRLKTVTPFNLAGKHKPKAIADRKDLKIVQTETVYFVNRDGQFDPYLKLEILETDGDIVDGHGKKKRVIEADVFEKYTTAHFAELNSFAGQNKLSFKDKEDIVKILDEYERLIAVH
ncbi:MAG TPA: hypothetical protein VL943_03630 [Niabella sp.]|nr:hypothetical protein [Niabella sp.]